MEIGPGTVIDRYTVETVLGEGGMAVVYKVRHNTLGSYHALKVLSITSPELKKRLVQEGRVQGQLRHPNIVQVTDVVEVGDAPALVMEFIEGPTLDDYVEKQRPTLEQVDALAQGILDGVAAAHAKGLVHRDLKPGNILLQISASGLTPKITDFGLAKVRNGEPGGWTRTREGTAMGTPHYMSPEQIRDAASVGEPGDVFAIGAILYELITGKRAFDGEDILEIFNRVATAQYRPVRELVPNVPERMERAISGALRERIEDRVQTVTDLHAVWNGERLGPWDPKTLGDMVAMLPAESRARTRFSIAPFTRYSSQAIMGGGVFVVGAAVFGLGLLFVFALGVGFWGLSTSSAIKAVSAPVADAAVLQAGAPSPTTAPLPEEVPFVGPPVGESGSPLAEDAGVPAVATAANADARPVAQPQVKDPWAAGNATTSPASGAAPPTGGSPAERIAGLERIADTPSATAAIGDLMKNDPDAGVKKHAFRILIDRSDRGIGAAPETGLLLGWMARNGATDQRVEACEAIGRKGTSLADLGAALNHSSPTVRRAAIDALVSVGKRTGQQGGAQGLLQNRLGAEADAKTTKRLTEALASL